MDEAEITERISPEMKLTAMQRARDRAKTARWDLDVAVFLFAILATVIILSFQGIGVEITAPVAIFGLAMGWLVGWRKDKQAYDRFYNEELLKLEQERTKKVEESLEETIEEKVQKALRQRWR